MHGLLVQCSFEHAYPFHALNPDGVSPVPAINANLHSSAPPHYAHPPIPVAKHRWPDLKRRSRNVRQRTEPRLLRTEPGTKLCVVLRPFKEATHGSHID